MPVRYHLFSVLAIIILATATPLTRRWDVTTVKHSWSAVPEDWVSLGHASAGTTIDLYLALKSHNENALIDVLYEVSSPGHRKYGAHLSKGLVAELVAPHPYTLELVKSWLEDHGVPSSSISTTLGGNWLKIIGVPVSQANDILGASYRLYQHVETNDTVLRTVGYSLPDALHEHIQTVRVLRTVGYSLPDALHEHIQTVAPTTYFGSLRARTGPHAPTAQRLLPRGGRPKKERLVTPSYVRWLYKTMGYVPKAVKRNALGIVGFRGEYASTRDLQGFMKEYRTDGEDAAFTVLQINGGVNDESHPGSEASLNVQFAAVMVYPTPLVFYSTGGGLSADSKGKPLPGDAYLEWLEYLIRQSNIPPTISISYGTLESVLPLEYAKALCELFAKLGVLGVSVLAGSGDDGVGRGDCKDRSGKVRFTPMFPASCPWVTSVGGTVRDPEVAAGFSGGGFSQHFPRPEYQDEAVFTFLKHLDKDHTGLYNPEGRGVPDIAAQAHRFVYIRDSVSYVTSGTSCSAPVVAGVISLLNDYLLSKGKDPLGFLNPWLYGKGLGGLKDITSGSNPACGTPGFSAIVGWDPVTGLGTLDFDKLEDIIDARMDVDHTPTR